MGLELAHYDVRSADDFAATFAEMTAAGTDSLLMLQNRFFSQNREPLLSLVAQHRLPLMGDTMLTRAGGLMSYMADTLGLYRQLSTYVDKILKGAKPADLPIEQPKTFDFVMNLKTAQTLGLTIPQSVLLQATEIIQ